jgi:hypothetical protein
MFGGTKQAVADLLTNVGHQTAMRTLQGAFDQSVAVDMTSFR